MSHFSVQGELDVMATKCQIRTLSLFSGAGGLDIGFHQAGFDILACVEIEKVFSETLSHPSNNLNGKENQKKEFIQEIWNMRFDLRSSYTNRTIEKGYFMSCYPFPRGYGKMSSTILNI